MNVVRFIFLLLGVVLCAFCGLLAVSSIRERKARTAAISAGALLAIGASWFGVYLLLSHSDYALAVPVAAIVVLVALFFTPIGQDKSLRIAEVDDKVDERDVMFAREEYLPGSEKYDRYYAVRPELKTIDDKLRRLPELLSPGGRYYDPVRSEEIDSVFRLIEGLTTEVDGEISETRLETDPTEMSRDVKELVRGLGADEVGIARLNPMYIYSHVGRGPERWGAPIENNHQYAVVFTLEMDFARVEAAPHLPITEETVRQYLREAQISISLARHIRGLGYPARAHIAGSNYQIMLPPVAHDAGLGELGRIGYLISPRFGARIRLGAVTTNLPLVPGKPVSFGVQDFCEKCTKCATNCPPAAIPKGGKSTVRGVEKWQLSMEKCIHYWRVIGTDCGMCMKVCPFSHPPTLVHNVVRAGIRRSSFARTVSVWGDDLLYGKKDKLDGS